MAAQAKPKQATIETTMVISKETKGTKRFEEEGEGMTGMPLNIYIPRPTLAGFLDNATELEVIIRKKA